MSLIFKRAARLLLSTNSNQLLANKQLLANCCRWHLIQLSNKSRLFSSMAYTRVDGNNSIRWQPKRILDANNCAILLLNHALDNKSDSAKAVFANLWSKGALRIAVDGGSNALFDNNMQRPDIISGDFDSIRPELIDHYRNAGSEVMSTPDQDDTDFGKAVSVVNKSGSRTSQSPITSILAITSLGGRLDHVLSSINTLYQNINQMPIFLYDIEVSLSWVLSKDCDHFVDVGDLRTSSWCSLVPVGHKCRVSTTGFKWDLNESVMKFGELISTSNQFDEPSTEVSIKTDHALFLSVHFP